MADPVAWYDANFETVVAQYEALSSDAVHGWIRDLLPKGSATILDVGAGSGRDAAWLAAKGHDVVAVEPSASMRTAGASMHARAPVRWIDDRLPALAKVSKIGVSFDLILLSAVWMHLAAGDRPRAFRKIVNLLKPGGLLAITLRDGPVDHARGIHQVFLEEVEDLARDHGAFVERHTEARDHLGRENVRWIQLAIRLPDDGTGALPLLRHVILNDDKSSTYKLALLRTLCRLAEGAAGFARDHDDDFIAVPLGLVALTWLRLFKPLLSANLPQHPRNVGLQRLGFVKDGYRRLADVSHQNMRVGITFSGEHGAALHRALKDAANTIARMPATHISYPNGSPVFPILRSGRAYRPSQIKLDDAYLYDFGKMLVPRHLWKALRRFSAWVEPALVSEWSRLIRSYAASQNVQVEGETIAASMAWDEPKRYVGLARERALNLMVDGKLNCVWSARKLDEHCLDIDHCLPWTAWACGDLWNLMPAHRAVNQREKRARLPTDRLLQSAQERVVSWWEAAYVKNDAPIVSERFWLEAKSSLPTVDLGDKRLSDVFEAVCLQRIRLKHDQQVPEWAGERHLQAD
ncbi:MAG: methyltransferase domain-containing protein [Albidovulum sp.]|nr:methyltransferase domain-containing protein [Albidovulum sp.]MDE0303270.1 methyltransferase domain-containing protein [Albidovulum sp.]